MNRNNSLSLCVLSLFAIAGAQSATISVTSSAAPAGALTNYSYVFTIAGTSAGIDTVFLGSNDLSPLNVAFKVDGAATANWSFLGNNSPQNYLEFFSTNGSSLNAGDTFGVTFSSIFTPGSEFAVAENSTTGAVTNQVTGLVGPSASAVPEPASAGLMIAVGAGLLAIGRSKWCLPFNH